MAKRDLINITDLDLDELDRLLALASDIIESPEKYQDKCAHKTLATLFYEPSTRTRLSFESAMYGLGGNVVGFSDANSCDVPVINAGDGGHLHPSQTLTDLLTILRNKGRLTDLKVGFCGDLKFGRTVHSLILALLRYKGIEVVLISPDELKLPSYNKDAMDDAGIKWVETTSLEEALPELDVLYMTRVQKERFFNEEDYVRLKDTYILDGQKLEYAKDDLVIMHPLPRVNEISVEVDKDPRAKYFDQVKNGRYARMALILMLLGIEGGLN